MKKRSRSQSPAAPHYPITPGPLKDPSTGSSLKASSEPLPSVKPYHTPPESFPIFRSGDVYIQSKLAKPSKNWQLQSDVLARHSSWFARSLEQDQKQEDSNKNDQPTSYSYTIEDTGLVRQQVKGDESLHKLLDNESVLGMKVELEETKDSTSTTKEPSTLTTTPASASPPKAPRDLIYNQVFGAFYNIPPSIPINSISAACTHSEQLVELAHNLGCLHLITSHISTALLSYRQILFTAIKDDPARWLLLSLKLQNDNIYTESLIHLAGAHPCWPWPTPTKRTHLPDSTRRLIAKKSSELDQACLEAERSLLLLTIRIGRTSNSSPVQPEDPSHFPTWFVVQSYRDILARELHALESSKSAALKRGTMFRKIWRGGSAYMDYEEMRRLMEQIMPSAVENLSEDLALLKEFAGGIVDDLARNEAMVDVEACGVGWLTCVRVERGSDIPWRNGGGGEKSEG
ncbi:hypothetical protein N0V83_007645 [Neocucurbitaria cava]|uniref:Uncharacterized protein n=1 Tax=Neocucurbitaria cava TaxID=798079 RepID=A0A9W9CJM4_9PLEO|nr:hypothetical protein N0V83_007645 [Neocucurbitaria cava]